MVAGIPGKRLVIVGGLGPETSCSFCLQLNRRIKKITRCQPDIVMENVAVPLEVESRIIKGELCKDIFFLLKKAVVRLNKSNSDFIVIPCNTVHVFIEELRGISKKPIISIIEECAKECSRLKAKKVGILGSDTTIKQGLHSKELEKKGIEAIVPLEQGVVSSVILRILDGKADESDKKKLMKIISELKAKGADAVILGCTDLDILVKKASLPLVDTTKVLEDIVVQHLS